MSGYDAAFLSSSQFFNYPLRKPIRIVVCIGVLSLSLIGSWRAAVGQAKIATTTAMAMSSSSGAVTTASAGTVITLTATVHAGTSTLTRGQVSFCDATATHCTDTHLLGTAQLTSAGTATMKFRPGLGTHSYKAVYLGTQTDSASSSSALALTVTGTPYPLGSSTVIAETGSWGSYSLTATVTEYGGTAAPTGSVSFLDMSQGSSTLASASLGAAVAGIHWPIPLGLSLPTNSPSAEAIGDFNGDGIPDLIINAGGPNQPAVIFLGNADGTYTSVVGPSIFTYSFGPLVVADFNGDGRSDVAALNANSGVVTILLGNGDGTFAIAGSSPASGSGPRQLGLGDFNGDGIPDLAVTDSSTDSVNILLGNGDGTFTVTTSPPAVGATPNAIAVGDFNGDGYLDLAVTDTYDDSISILLGNGDGTFASATTLHSGSNGSPVVVADFSGDGKLDLAVGVAGTNGASDSVTILFGNGDGTFTTPPTGTAANAISIAVLQVGDFNADGIADLVLMNSATGTFTVFLGGGAGSFTSTTETLLGDPSFGLSAAVGDLNGDGRTDLFVGVSVSDALVYLTEAMETATATAAVAPVSAGQHLVEASFGGDSDYNASTSTTIPLWGQLPTTSTTMTVTAGGSATTSVTPGTPVTITAAVLAGTTPITTGQIKFCDASVTECSDIHLLATAEITAAGTATYKFVPGPGTYSYRAEFVEEGFGLASASATSNLTVGPAPNAIYFDSVEIAASGYPGDYTLTGTVVGFGGSAAPTGTLSFLDTSFGNTSLGTASLGTATAGLGFLTSPAPTLSGAPASQVTGDFNGDGIADLAVIWTSSIYGEGPFSVTLSFGNGDGTFTAGPTISPAGVQLSPELLAGDFNGDGKTDLAVLSYDGYSKSYITILIGNGDGTFAAPQTGTVYNQGDTGGDTILGSMIAADFNGDGKLDLAVAGDYVGTGGIIILLGNGDGTFSAQPNLVPKQGMNVVAAGDFNGDGIPDLITSPYFVGGATVLLGKGDGTFTVAATAPAANPFVQSIVVGDFDRDGKLDVAVGYTGGVSIFLGNGDGSFQSASNGTISGSGVNLTVGDFNHDGLLDLAALDGDNGGIALYLGAGDGSFTSTTTALLPFQQFNNPLALISADFNGDGRPDLALLQRYVDNASTLITEPTQTAAASINGIAPVSAATHLVEASYSGDSNYAAGVSGTTSLTAGVAPPVISSSTGTFSSAQSISITDTTPGAVIMYAASGAMNTYNFVTYTGPIPLEGNGAVSIQAFATESGYVESETVSASFTLNFSPAATPVMSLAAGTYTGPQSVTFSDTTPGATIYYTTDGSTPTNGNNVYSGPISVSATEVLKAIAIAPGYSNSSVASAAYTINQPATPTINWSAPGSIVYGSALGSAQLNATANVPGTFVYSPAAGTVLGAGKQTLSVTFTPTDTTSYKTATATVALTVNQATPSITWATPAPTAFGAALSATQLNATASVPGTFTYTPAAGAIPAIGSDTLTVALTPTDATDYTTATATVTLIVDQPAPTLGSLSPAFGTADGPTFTLTVGGSGFTSASVVDWGSTALTTHFVTGTQLTAQVPASAIANAGTISVTVQNPAPGGGVSNAMQFEIDSAGSNTPPTLGVLTATVSPGSSASYPVTLPSGVSDVSASCLNLPVGASCSYSATSGGVIITTSPTTLAGTYQLVIVFTETTSGPASAVILLPILLSPLMFLRRRWAGRGLRIAACLALLVAGAAGMSGCGGGGGGSTGTLPDTHQTTTSASATLIVQ